MLKKIQIRIILFFALIGILIIAGISLTYINNLKAINTSNIEMEEIIEDQIYQTEVLLAVYFGVFLVIVVVFGFIISKFILAPVNGIIDNAKQTAESGNEAIRQMKQLETILLHMTDGIIAFDLEGEIMHINPAATELLRLKEENNFNEIFSKFDVDINLEKIIYLENWTSSEKIINVEEKTINLFFAPFKDENEEYIFTTKIPRNVKLAEAPSHGQPCILYQPDCSGTKAYVKLAKEIIKLEGE